MLSCYEFDVGISNTDLMRETDVRLTESFAQNVLDSPIGAEPASGGGVAHGD